MNLATVVSLVAGASALVLGTAIFAGWRYTQAYYTEFGIERSALNFSPYEYALRGFSGLTPVIPAMFVLAVAFGFCLGVLETARRFPGRSNFPTPVPEPAPAPLGEGASTKTRRSPRLIEFRIMAVPFLAVLVACLFFALVAIPVVTIYFDNKTLFVFAFPALAIGAPAIWLFVAAVKRDRELYPVVWTIAVLGFLSVLMLVPPVQGELTARDVHNHPDKLPAVWIDSKVDLRLDHNGGVTDPLTYGPYRLILRNNGMYYLTSDDSPNETIAIPEDSILHLKIQK